VPRAFWRGTNSFGRGRASGARECRGASWFNCSARGRRVAASLRARAAVDAGFTAFTPWESCLCGSAYGEVKAVAAAPWEALEAQERFRYLVSVDGYTAAWRLARLLSLGSLVLKQDSPFDEFWYGWLRRGVHYVPLAEDLGDLLPRVEWAREHGEEARRVARAGSAFVRKHLALPQLQCFWASMLRAYAQLQDFDPSDPPDSVAAELVDETDPG